MQDLVEHLSALLAQKKIMLVTAESCTGGLLAAAMTHRAGASSVFERGFVTYSNESKMELLNVPSQILADYGAVSTETAQAMALGALKNSQANIALSITGIAGPDGGSEDKPVGLVFFGWAIKNQPAASLAVRFEGDRIQIRSAAVSFALKHLIEILELHP
jgi:nicotinamide-nucleotide amidase